MRVEVIMPQMGESIVEGQIVEWLKKVGDPVKRDEDIFILSTDKVDAEVPSPVDGVLVACLAAPGDTVEVGAVVAYVETDAAAAKAAIEGGGTAAPAASQPSAAVVEVAASSPAPVASPPSPALDAAPAADADVAELRRQRSTPLVRKLAKVHGLTSLGNVVGTGVSGRVTKKDLLAFLEKGGAAQASEPAAPPAVQAAAGLTKAAPAPKSAAAALQHGTLDVPAGYRVALEKPPRVHVYEGDRVEPMSRMRASIAENMLQARRTTAHCATLWEADVTEIVRARKALGATYGERGVRLTFTPFFLAAIVEGLRKYPILNAAIDGDKVIYRRRMNLGVASAVEEGLIVPVVKDADALNLFGLAKAVNDLAERSKNKQLKPADVADGTFTLSNAGVFGSLVGIPILVQPQVGILGVGGIKKRVVADDDDNIRVRSIVTMCLTFDHRLVDGESADGFMRTVVGALSRVPS